MASLFVLDVKEYLPLSEKAESPGGVGIRRIGPYLELRFDSTLTIDRVSTGMRHALWYSGIAALLGASVIQYDKTSLRLQADNYAPPAGGVTPSSGMGSDPLRRERITLVPPLERGQWSAEAEAAIQLLPEVMRPAEGQTINSLSVLANHPPLAAAYLRFSLYLRFGSTLPGRTREMLILRTAWLRQAEYELLRHARLGRRQGLTEEEIARIPSGSQAHGWAPLDGLVLTAAEELCGSGRVRPDTWSALSERFSLQEMMDLVFTVGAFDMLAMAFNTFGVEPEPDLPPFPQPI